MSARAMWESVWRAALLAAAVAVLVTSGLVGARAQDFDFVMDPYSWRGPDWESGPVFTSEFLLSDFQSDMYSYCGGPWQDGGCPQAWFGAELTWEPVDESCAQDITEHLTVQIEGVTIYNSEWTHTNPGPCHIYMDGNAPSSINKLSAVMQAAGSKPVADGEAHVWFSMLGVTHYASIPFTAEIPRYEGFYVLDEVGDWQPASGYPDPSKPLYVIVHGWQSRPYPDFVWVGQMGRALRAAMGDSITVGAWFWQKEATSWYPPSAKGNIRWQATKLAQVLLNGFVARGGLEFHLIGHSYGGAVAAGAEALLKDQLPTEAMACLVLLDVPENFWFSPVNVKLRPVLEALRPLPVANYYTQYGAPYELPNVENILVCGNGDHKAPIYYLIESGIDACCEPIEVVVEHYYPEEYYLGITAYRTLSMSVTGPNITSQWQYPTGEGTHLVAALSQRPAVGDHYGISYTNGCGGVRMYDVDGVNDDFAFISYPADGSAITTTTPTFTWVQADSSKGYNLVLTDDEDQWLWSEHLPTGTSSAPCGVTLTPGEAYVLYLHSYDAKGNQATTTSHFSVE